MKLIKTLIKIILFIILFVIIGAVVFLLVIMDTSDTSFKPTDGVSIEEVLGSDLNTSLNTISGLDNEGRKTDKNAIEISFTTEELNNFIVEIIRSNISQNYLKEGGETKVFTAGPSAIDSVFFEDYGENTLSVKARVEALNFYKTSLTLAGTPSIEGDELVFKFTDFKLGNRIGLTSDQVIGFKDFFKLNFGSISGFDLDTMTFRFDISSFMESSNAFGNIIKGVDKNCEYKDKNLVLKFDTRNIFTELQPIQEPVASFEIPDLALLALEHKLELTENQFNFIIKHELENTTNDAQENGATGGSFKIGSNEFTYKLEKLYYNIDTEQMQAYIYINEAKANLVADVDISTIKSGDYVDSLKIKVKTIKLGNTLMDASNFFSEIIIPASNFTFGYDLHVKDIKFNKTEEKCDIEFA